MLDLSIVIVNYKSPHLIEQCIRSIVSNEKELSYEIIVVDNNSDDNSETILKKIYPDLKWIQMGYNSGFGRANNVGIKEAKGNFILILNSDCIIKEKNTLFNCINKHKQVNTEKTILGIRLVDENHQYQETLRLTFPGIKREIRANAFYIYFVERLFGRKFKGKEYQKAAHYKSGEVAYINGAFLLLKTKELIGNNLFYDEDFFLYGEDIEWAWRAVKNNFTFYHWHDPEIIHLGSASSNNYKKHRYQQIITSDWLYFKKTRGLLYTTSTILTILINQLIDSAFHLIGRIRRRKFSHNEIEQVQKRKWIYEILIKYSFVVLFYTKVSDKKSFKTNCYAQ